MHTTVATFGFLVGMYHSPYIELQTNVCLYARLLESDSFLSNSVLNVPYTENRNINKKKTFADQIFYKKIFSFPINQLNYS